VGADDFFGGGGDDLMFGGTGEDGLTGGLGEDTMFGGGGSDFLDGADGVGDDILDCGDADFDNYTADDGDIVNANCERDLGDI